MWIKKDSNEILKESIDDSRVIEAKKKKALRSSIWLSIFAFFGTLTGSIIEGMTVGNSIKRWSNARLKVVDFNELPDFLPNYLMKSAFISVALFPIIYFTLRNVKKTKDTLMCDKCNSVKNKDNNLNCKCGGVYYDISEYKWIDKDNK